MFTCPIANLSRPQGGCAPSLSQMLVEGRGNTQPFLENSRNILQSLADVNDRTLHA